MQLCTWVRKRAIPQNTLSQPSADAPHCPPTVKLTGEFKLPAEWELQVHRACPAVHAPTESPTLPAVISSGADREVLSTNLLRPRKSRRIRRLARILSPAGISFV